MRLTNQIVALLCLCVLGTVLLATLSAALGFHALTDRFQREELRAVVEIFEQEVLAQVESPRLQGWLPPLLRANGVQELTVTLDDAQLFHYQEAGRDLRAARLQRVDTPFPAPHQKRAQVGLGVHAGLGPVAGQIGSDRLHQGIGGSVDDPSSAVGGHSGGSERASMLVNAIRWFRNG